jgi:predicted type IV restriction endonuclease/energy-coupling factor transporter ATP-binding protein EcfA2
MASCYLLLEQLGDAMNLDTAHQACHDLFNDLKRDPPPLDTEQDVRFQIINRMIISVLGWDSSEIKTEPHTESGYIDYLLTHRGRNRFVVEAKRTSTNLVDTKSSRLGYYTASGPALQSANEGLKQAQRYCSETGVLFSALTNGYQWIAFWAIRSDGTKPGEGKTIVFNSLECVLENFAIFYDLFSREGILSNLYQVHIHKEEGLTVHNVERLTPIVELKEVQLRRKSQIASDLETIYRGFFGTISGENDLDMLAKCFVESKESHEADASLSKITQNLVNQVKIVTSSEAKELQKEIESSLETQKGEFVLIVGNKGAGKTTFIDRFFRLILQAQLRSSCLILRVDLSDSSGDHERIVPWLVAHLKDELETNLFKGSLPTYEQLQGVFMKEYDRWRYGEHKYLYERDKHTFKEKFGDWIANLIQSSPEQYIQALLRSAIFARGLMPCIIFDNTDHFPQVFQERVFQFAQSIYRNIFSFIIFPITDRTIWQLSKAGPFQSYETRVFYLPVPSTKEVLAKRVSYIKEKITGQDRDSTTPYFLKKGIRLSVGDIHAFAACIEDIFVNEEYIGRIIGWLANHDIRRSLDIARRIIISPVLSIEDLVKAYLIGKSYSISARKIKQALLVGEYTHFNQSESNYILNLYEIRAEEITSPLIRMSILKLLMDKDSETTSSENSYITVDDILNYFEPARLARSAIKEHLSVLLSYRLIEPYDPTDTKVYEEQRVRVTHSGRIHYEFAFDRQDAVYLGQMAFATPMRYLAIFSCIHDRKKSTKLVWEDWLQIFSWFVEYCLSEDEKFVSLPNNDAYLGQRRLRNELRQTWMRVHKVYPSGKLA